MTNQNFGPIPGNYELQEAFLKKRQQEISNRLFELGVVSRLVEADYPVKGTETDLSGVAQLDSTFVPSVTYTRRNDREERILSLVAITPKLKGRSFSYIRIGMIDATDTLYPFPGITADDAQRVHDAATELVAAKTEGLLPNLNASLLDVFNPNTSIRKA